MQNFTPIDNESDHSKKNRLKPNRSKRSFQVTKSNCETISDVDHKKPTAPLSQSSIKCDQSLVTSKTQEQSLIKPTRLTSRESKLKTTEPIKTKPVLVKSAEKKKIQPVVEPRIKYNQSLPFTETKNESLSNNSKLSTTPLKPVEREIRSIEKDKETDDKKHGHSSDTTIECNKKDLRTNNKKVLSFPRSRIFKSKSPKIPVKETESMEEKKQEETKVDPVVDHDAVNKNKKIPLNYTCIQKGLSKESNKEEKTSISKELPTVQKKSSPGKKEEKKPLQQTAHKSIKKEESVDLDDGIDNCALGKIKDKLTFLQYEINQLRRSVFYSGFEISCPDAKVTIGGKDGVHLTKGSIGSEAIPVCDIYTKRIKIGDDSIRINKNTILFGSGISISENNLGSEMKPFKNSFTENLMVSGDATISGNLSGNVVGNVTFSELIVTGDINVEGNSSMSSINASGLITGNLSGSLIGDTHATGNSESTSTSSGALVVDGGVGIQKNLNVGGDSNIYGNLNVFGNTNIVEADDLFIKDNKIVLNSNTEGEPILDAFLIIDRGLQANAQIQWNETSDQWEITSFPLFVGNNIVSNASIEELIVTGNAQVQNNLNVLETINGKRLILTNDLTVQGNSSVASLTASGLITGNVEGSLIGNTRVTGTTNSTSKETGALVVDGGVGIHKDLHVGGNIVGNVIGTISTENLDLPGDLTVQGNSSVASLTASGLITGNVEGSLIGNTRVTGTTNSTSKETGALVVDGGVGIHKDLHVGGNIIGNMIGTITTDNLDLPGDLTVQGNSSVASLTASGLIIGNVVGALIGNTRVTGTTNSTSKETGALVVDGGVGIHKDMHVGGNIIGNMIGTITTENLDLPGDLTVQGNSSVASLTASSLITGNVEGSLIGNTRVTGTTNSTSTETGALVVDGGVGINDDLHVGGNIIGNIIGTITTENLDLPGDLTVQGNSSVASLTASGLITGNVEGSLIGNTRVTGTTNSTSKETGALVVDGGVGIHKDLHVGGNIVGNVIGTITTNNLDLPGDLTVQGNSSVASLTASGLITGNVVGTLIGNTRVTGTTNSTSKETGALVVDGGVGIHKDMHVGGNIVGNVIGTITTNNLDLPGDLTVQGNSSVSSLTASGLITGNVEGSLIGNTRVTGTTNSTSTETGALVVDGGVGINDDLHVGGNIMIMGPTNSSSSTSGALIIEGGVGIAKNLNIGGISTIQGDCNIIGNLIVSGNTDFINVNNFLVDDNKITLNANTIGAPILDAFFSVDRGDGIDANIKWNEDEDRWEIPTFPLVTENTISVNDTQDSSSSTDGALVVRGGIGVAKNMNIGGNVHIDSTAQSTGITTGALIVDGGIGVAGNIHIGGNVYGDFVGPIQTAIQNSITTMTSLSLVGTPGANITFSGPIVSSQGVIGDVSGDLTGNVTGDVTGNVTGDVTGNVTGDLTGNVIGDVIGNVTGDLDGNVTGDVTGNVIGDVIGNVTGDLDGNVTGDVTGNVIGDVTGNVTGDLSGNVKGDVTGNVTGDLSGNVTGDVTGNVTGDLSGNVTGNVIGDVTGDVTGNVTGDLFGNVTGDVIGNVTGDLSGNVTGDVTGNVTGDLFGNVTGDVIGNMTGDLSGNVTGDVTGSVTGDVIGNVTGDVIGNVTGDLSGNVTGDVTGSVTGDVIGNVTGDLSGNVTGDVTGSVTGDVTGNVTGDLSGNVTGDVTGNVTGDLSGSVIGDVTGNLTGNVIGDLTGNVTGNFTGNVIGNVMGDLSGDVTGNLTGNVTGDVIGDLTGNVTGIVSGNVIGDVIGDLTGNITANTFIFGTTESTNTTSGALIVNGGVGIAKNLNIGGTTTILGNCNVIGNFTVLGNTDLLNVTDLLVDDNKIILNANTSGEPILDAFLTIDRGDETDAKIQWNEDQNQWEIPNFPFVTGNILSVTDTTESTSTTIGALVVGGGIGVSKNVHIGGNLILNSNEIRLGSSAGNISESGNDLYSNVVAIGTFAGSESQKINSIAIGHQAGQTQGNNNVCIGYQAGQTSVGNESVYIGSQAGKTSNNTDNYNQVGIGASAGNTNQGLRAVAIGGVSGLSNQGNYSIAMGWASGYSDQGIRSVAIGDGAGFSAQDQYGVAIGSGAGYTSQQSHTIAIGRDAGSTSQGRNSIAIGKDAGKISQSDNTICLNATGSTIAANTNTDACYIAPIREDTNGNGKVLYYDNTTKEVHRSDVGFSLVNGNAVVDSDMVITSTTNSTTTTNGALTVAGGVGIEKNLNVGNAIFNSTGTLILKGGATGGNGATYRLESGGNSYIDSTTMTFRNQNGTTNFAQINSSYNWLSRDLLRVGVDAGSESTIYLGGGNDLDGQAWGYTEISSRTYESGTEKTELFLGKFNDANNVSGPDRIRLKAAQIGFDIYTTFTGAGNYDDDRVLTVNSDNITLASNTNLFMSGNGRIGIKTNTPACALDINADGTEDSSQSSTSTVDQAKYFSRTTGIINVSSFGFRYSIRCPNSIWINSNSGSAGENAFVSGNSDKRIKKDIEDLDEKESLDKIRSIQPVSYRYNFAANESRKSLGFLAQDVESLVPQSVNKVDRVIDNVAKYGTIEGNIITTSEPHGLEEISTSTGKITIHVRETETKEKEYSALNYTIIDDCKISVEGIDITPWSNEVYVYGCEVSDFRILDPIPILITALSAMKKMDKTITELQEKVCELENKLAQP